MNTEPIIARTPWEPSAEVELFPLPAWMERGLCAEIGDDFWFPEKGGSTLAAKRVCQSCPVIAECLEYAISNNERFGVWGGRSERERRDLMDARSTTCEGCGHDFTNLRALGSHKRFCKARQVAE